MMSESFFPLKSPSGPVLMAAFLLFWVAAQIPGSVMRALQAQIE